MKLIRFGEKGSEKPGVILTNGSRVDISSIVADFDYDFFKSGGVAKLINKNLSVLPEIPSDARLGAPIKRPGKIICIGLNFKDHAEESNMEIPSEPVIFFKATSSLTGPNDDVIIPKGSKKTDWEVELAFVMGKDASYVSEEEAPDYLGGYVLHNDVSERAFQLEMGGQWVKGKSCDTFAPLGPFIATPDEISDINNVRMWLTVNGEIKQDGTTANLIFNIPFIISYLSRFMTLEAGDIISTGTPAGVGFGFSPQQFIKDGDVVELGIDGLGSSKQTFIAY